MKFFFGVLLAAAMSQSHIYAQDTAIPWSAMNMGFAETGSATTSAQSAAGQLVVGAEQSATTASESGDISGVDALLGATQTFSLEVLNSWNMVSVPAMVGDYSRAALYPTSASEAFAYEAGYVVRSTLADGKGYWLKFSGDQSIVITGSEKTLDSIPVAVGWNMIGSISSPVPVDSITSDPGGIVTSRFFGYNGGYVVSASIEPGKAYWVKSSQIGKLILSSAPGGVTASNRIRIATASGRPPDPPETGASGDNIVPTEFGLDQNYPNPFNPATTFNFQLPSASRVTLKIIDVLGREVALIVNEELPPGAYNKTWDASGVPSGVYFYRLVASAAHSGETGSFSVTRKLLLVR
jgi:hypothetical protein